MKVILSTFILFISGFIQAQVVINEYSSKGGVTQNGESYDWVEIMNNGSSAVLLSDYFLSDDSDDIQKWQLPAQTIGPGEITVILASGNNIYGSSASWESIIKAENLWRYFPADEEPPVSWSSLGFSDSSWNEAPGGFGYADGDDLTQVEGFPSVYLRRTFELNDVSALQQLVLHADYDDAFVAYLNGIEICRSENIEGTPPAFDTYATIDHEANLYNSEYPEEFWFSPTQFNSWLQDGTNVLSIQVHNVGPTSSDFSSNFFLSTLHASSDQQFQDLPNWLVMENNNTLSETNFRLSAGEQLILSHQSGSISDIQEIPEDLTIGYSRGRFPDGSGPWCYFDLPSPFELNNVSECYSGFATPPEVSLPSGWYEGVQAVNATASGTIHYTTNGDVPEETDPVFSALQIEENTSLSFRAFNPGELPSAVVDRTYFLEEDNHNLPVFSVHVNDEYLFDFNNGIYEFGPNADLQNFPHFGSNFWEPWDRYARLEYFNSQKELLMEEELDLEIHGGWSRGFSQKSFRLDFKNEYTGDLGVNLFSRKPEITSFNNINLRNGGQHVWTSKVQDALFSRLVEGTFIDKTGYEPCLLYLNGNYWGIYGIREKTDEHFIEDNHGVDADSLDLLNSFSTLAGSNSHWIETVSILLSSDPTDEFFLDLFESRIDLENYMDYFIAETYYQNVDWLGIAWGTNNIKLWRPQTEEGRWRYIMYDTDAGFSEFWGSVFDNYMELAVNPVFPNDHSSLFAHVLQNPEFKCLFAKRYADLVNSIWLPENFNEEADSIEATLLNAMEDHTLRWPENISVEEWIGEMNALKNYNSQRRAQARNHVEGALELGGQYTITLNVEPEGAGLIEISTLAPQEFPWSGVYFNACPVDINATSEAGYQFSGWSSNGPLSVSLQDSSVSMSFTQDRMLTAHFESTIDIPEVEQSESEFEVYPNPTNGFTTVKLKSSSVGGIELAVYDLTGKKVRGKPVKKFDRELVVPLDLSELQKGVYLLELKTESYLVTKRITLN